MDKVQYFVLHCLVEYRTLRLPQLKTAGGGRTFVFKSSLLPITFDALVTGMI